MLNIIILLLFFCNCFNLGFFSNNYFNVIIKNKFESIIFSISLGLLVTFFLVWIIGSIILEQKIFFIAFLLINLILIVKNFQKLKNFCISTFLINQKIKNINKSILYLISLIIISYLIIGFAPPTDIDSLNYHLSLPKKDIEFGKIIMNGWNESEYMPMFIENMARFLLLFGNETIMHQFNWIIFILILISLSLAGKNLNLNTTQITISILFFILIKGNMWLVSTAHNELLLTFYTINLFNVLLNFKKDQSNFNIFKLIIISISLLYIKYHGIIFLFSALIILLLYVLGNKIKFQKKYFFYSLLPIIFYLPLLIRNYYLVGDPLYPLFMFYEALSGVKEYGVSTSFFHFLFGPINFTLFPNKYFDGNYLGSPYLIYLLYSGLFFIDKSKQFRELFIFSFIYYIFWFYGLSQQVRYLLPILALVSIYSAFVFYEILNLAKTKIFKFIFVGTFIIFLTNQLVFLTGYLIIKAPVALGFISKEKYLSEGTDTDYAFYKSCKFLNQKLDKNNYIPLVIHLSYYCPQKKSLRAKNRNFLKEKNLSANQIKSYLKNNKIKFIYLQTKDRKITETGFSFRPVDLIDKNLESIINKNSQIVYQDFQTKIYELSF